MKRVSKESASSVTSVRYGLQKGIPLLFDRIMSWLDLPGLLPSIIGNKAI